jgi:hypothetical protein
MFINIAKPVIAAAAPIITGAGLTALQHIQTLVFVGSSAALVYQAGKYSNQALDYAVNKSGSMIASAYTKHRTRRFASKVEKAKAKAQISAEIERLIDRGELFRTNPTPA